MICACGGGPGATPADREVEVVEALDPDSELEPFSTELELAAGRISEIAVGPTPLEPTRAGADAQPASLRFRTESLVGASASIGLLPPRAAARQEVAHDMPGQPDDPRARWIEHEILADGVQEVELPVPGPGWHAPWAIVVAEIHHGRARLPVVAGPRSEMVAGGERSVGGRAVLAVVAVETRPTRIVAPAVEPGVVTLDGALDEWPGAATRLVHSRTGEPADDIDARVGGPTEVSFAWDRESLYVGASLGDRDLYAPHEHRDDPLYRDEAFEVFVAGDGSGAGYLEHQISARGVVFDAQFARYRAGDEDYDGPWRYAVRLDGELGRRGGDRGWTVELAFPWTELCAETKIECPPSPGQTLRVNVFRVDKPERKAQVALALSPTLEPDFHAWQNAAELVLGDDARAEARP